MERLLYVGQLDFVLRALWACYARAHVREVEVQGFGVVAVAFGWDSENPLGFEIVAGEGNELFVAACEAQVFEGCVVHREVAHSRPVFGRHVCDCRAVGKGKALCALSEKFDEFADHFFFP